MSLTSNPSFLTFDTMTSCISLVPVSWSMWALRSRDQIRAILAAHPINVADDAEPFGRVRLILSLNGFRASRSAERCHNPDRGTEQHQRTDLAHKTSLNLSWRASEALPSTMN